MITQLNRFIGPEFYQTYLKFRQEWDANNKVFEQVYKDYFLENKPNPYIVD